MGRIEKTVFISYRRTNMPWALAIFQNLTAHGYDVFFDYESINSGDFEQVILGNIRARAHFLVVLTPSALERCTAPDDWLRREIETALDNKRNIIPLFLEGFNFSNPAISRQLTGKLSNLRNYNGLNVPPDYFNEAMERLHNRFLNIALDTVLHPISVAVQEAVQEQQVAANKMAMVKKEDLIFKRQKDIFNQTVKSQWNGIPESLEKKILEIINMGYKPKCVALGPDSSYVFLYNKNEAWWNNIPESLSKKILEINKAGGEFRSIALGTNSSYVFLFNKNEAWWNDIPESLSKKMQEINKIGGEFRSVALGPNSSCVFLFNKNEAWWNNIPESLSKKILEINKIGGEFKSVALGPDSSYVFLFNKNEGWWYNVPDNLAKKVFEINENDGDLLHVALGENSSYVLSFHE